MQKFWMYQVVYLFLNIEMIPILIFTVEDSCDYCLLSRLNIDFKEWEELKPKEENKEGISLSVGVRGCK